MTLKDLVNAIQETGSTLQNTKQDLGKINVKFVVNDRSEGTEIDVDNIDQILYDILNPTNVKIILS